MMIQINRQGDKDHELITGSVNGKQFSVSFDATKWELMKDLQAQAEEAKDMTELRGIVEKFEPLTVESYKELVETKSPFIMVNKHTNKFYLKYADKVSRHPMPQILVDKIIKSVEKDISPLPIIKLWVRFIREVPGRPKFTEQRAKEFAAYIEADYTNDEMVTELTGKQGLSQDIAKERATTKQVGITQEGLLVCYKVSKEITHKFVKDPTAPNGVKKIDRDDFDVDEITGEKNVIKPDAVEDRIFEPAVWGQGGDAFLSGPVGGPLTLGHVIRVGAIHELPDWKQVGPPGGPGLHCGGLRYIQGYQKDGTVTHNIFVDPMDIHSVRLGYGSDGAMTVRRYFVHSSFAGVNKNIYHSSTFAAVTDTEFAAMVQKAVEETAMQKVELDSMLDETKALANAGKGTKDGNIATQASDVFGGIM